MKIKNTSVRLATVVLVLAGGLPLTAAADKMVEMDLRFAGSFATGIMHVDPMTGESRNPRVRRQGYSPGPPRDNMLRLRRPFLKHYNSGESSRLCLQEFVASVCQGWQRNDLR